jgi:hypothetical protein
VCKEIVINGVYQNTNCISINDSASFLKEIGATRKLIWYDYLLIIILSSLATWLASIMIKAETFETIIE